MDENPRRNNQFYHRGLKLLLARSANDGSSQINPVGHSELRRRSPIFHRRRNPVVPMIFARIGSMPSPYPWSIEAVS